MIDQLKPGDEIKETRSLVLGDMIVGDCYSNGKLMYFSGDCFEVLSTPIENAQKTDFVFHVLPVDKDGVKRKFDDFNHNSSGSKKWIIRSSTVTAAPSATNASASGKRVIPEYPHHCTRCGQPSYNGWNEIVHQRPNPSCPASR